MQATKQLPAHYYEHASLDLSGNKRAAVILNLVGVPLLLGWGWLFILLAQRLNPAIRNMPFTVELITLPNLLLWLFALVGVIILHELVHGFFIWLFTKQRPAYGYSWYYAYAGAPNWYFSRWPYVVVSLSPLVIISLVGVMLLPFVAFETAVTLLLALITNAAGAIGDMYVTTWLLWQPPTVLVQDTGPAFTLYRQHL